MLIENKPKEKTIHALRKQTAQILGGRFAKCGCTSCSKTNTIPVYKYSTESSFNAYFSNVVTCGSMWGCPVCAAKKSIEKGSELADVIKYSAELGKKIHFVTLTIPHSYGEKIEDLKDFLVDSWRYLTSTRQFKNAKRRGEYENYVKSIEVTFGGNGWHPHIHLLFVSEEKENNIFYEKKLYQMWSSVVWKISSKETSVKGYVYKQAYDESISEYLTKWDLSKELTSNLKTGKAGRTPMQLAQGSQADKKRFKAFVTAFKGVSKVRYSRGFKELRKDILTIKKKYKNERVKHEGKTKKAIMIDKELQTLRALINNAETKQSSKEEYKKRIEILNQERQKEINPEVASRFNLEKKQVLTLSTPVFNALCKLGKQNELLVITEKEGEDAAVNYLFSLFQEQLEVKIYEGCYFIDVSSNIIEKMNNGHSYGVN